MTNQEARKYFGLKDSDIIVKESVQKMMDDCNKRLSIWSVPEYEKKEIEKEIEALEALLK